MYYLAVDIGASSGRHILGSIENGKIVIEEVYRFKNGNVRRNGHLCWEVDRLFEEIKNGMKACAERGKNPVSMAIDCFGVDFVLLDENDAILGDTIAYRDDRTDGMPEAVYKKFSYDKLYARTGVQTQRFNSLYQLYSIAHTSDHLKKAKRYLHLAEYFNFLLTGVQKNEFTVSSTTQMLNAVTRDFDGELLDTLGFPRHIFEKPCMPGISVGRLLPAVMAETGLDCEVVLAPAHDTASAVMAVPTTKPCMYISSGTWSLMGTLLPEVLSSEKGRDAGFSNEGAHDGGSRYLKNIMGLWIIQSIKRELEDQYSFGELCDMAKASDYAEKIDVNDDLFLAPESMLDAIRTYLASHGAPAPESLGDILSCVYHSLAQSYGETVRELETITGNTYDVIHIIGGGSQDNYLNQLTAQYTGKTVFAGPIEATAIGNIVQQMLKSKEFSDLAAAKAAIYDSFPIYKI